MPDYCKVIDVDDISVGYSMVGRGDPLLLIMGFGGTQDYWGFPFLTELSKHFRVIVYDNRGVGETSIGGDSPSIKRFAQDAAGLLKALNIDRAHVMGWSMGSYIAQELAIAHPDLVDGLVLYSSCSDHGVAESISPGSFRSIFKLNVSDEKRTEIALRVLFPDVWLKEHPDFSRAFLSRPMTVYSLFKKGIEGQVAAIRGWSGTSDRIKEIVSSTLVVAGELDVVVPCQLSRELAEKLSTSRYISFKTGGHGLLYQYPKNLAQVVISHLLKK